MSQEVRIYQPGYTSGELSPSLWGRSDFKQYPLAVAKLQNMIPTQTGAVVKRPGTKNILQVKDSSKPARLIPMNISQTEQVLLILNDGVIRVVEDDAYVGAPTEVAHPYSDSDLSELQFFQYINLVFLVHRNHAPRVFARTTPTSFSLTAPKFVDGPYDKIITTNNLTQSGAGSTRTFAAAANTFKSSDVGRLLRVRVTGQDWAYGTIASFVSDSQVTATQDASLPWSVNGTAEEWQLGAWGFDEGYPGAIGFFEQRLVMGGSFSFPDTNWFSTPEGYSKDEIVFSPSTKTGTIGDEEGFTRSLGASSMNRILWYSGGASLAVGTENSEWSITPGDNSQSLSPTNIRANQSTGLGTRLGSWGVRVGGQVLFIQLSGKRVREFAFVFTEDKFESNDLSLFSDHLMVDDLAKRLAISNEPNPLVWAITDSSRFLSLTYLPSQDVGGWARHELGGSFGSGSAQITDLAVIFDTTDNYDASYFIVSRTVDGNTVQFLEKLDYNEYPSRPSGRPYMDGATKVSGEKEIGSIVTGLTDYAGSTCRLVVDGGVGPEVTVASDGSFTLPRDVDEDFWIGYDYQSQLWTLENALDGLTRRSQSGRASKIQWQTGKFLIYASNYLELGFVNYAENTPVFVLNETLDLRRDVDAMDTPVPLKSLWLPFPIQHDTIGETDYPLIGIAVNHSLPQPLMLLAHVLEGSLDEI